MFGICYILYRTWEEYLPDSHHSQTLNRFVSRWARQWIEEHKIPVPLRPCKHGYLERCTVCTP